MDEREKMARGLWYDANFDPDLKKLRLAAKDLCFRLNQTQPSNIAERERLLCELLPQKGKGITINSPFEVDYGFNCVIGDDSYFNRNVYLMDGALITIGTHCFIGPFVGIYTATHPLIAKERNLGYEKALPVTLGNNVWIGAGAILLPGVTIGNNSVIGAGSVVTRDIPAGVIATGNPCRVLRPITEDDRMEKTVTWD